MGEVGSDAFEIVHPTSVPRREGVMGRFCCDTERMFWTESARDVVEVAGPDAASYLQSQVSNDLRGVAVGASVWAFLLQPTGKIDVLVRIWRRADDAFVLDTDAGFGEAMIARLNRFKIRVKAEITPLDWRCIAVRRAAAAGDGAASADDAEDAEDADDAGADGQLVAWGGGADLLGPDVVAPAGVDPGSAADLLAARIEAGWPALGAEIVSGETIPGETGITGAAVSFTKGCYPGQELIERMDSRDASAPRLVQVVDVAVGTAVGDPLLRDGAVIGTVTSVAGTRALALVKRSALRPGP